jgi:ZIP family zinc transporter/zinc and cadmium transporter
MNPITTSILLGVTAALANGLGGAVIVRKDWERRYLRYFVALGAGFMLGTALLEMLPESMELAGPRAPLLLLVGYFIVHFFEHTLTGHFHFGEETHAEEFGKRHRSYSVVFGLIIHTFFDGIAIASGFLISGWLGWVIFLAVILHKVPEGFTASSVMLAGGSTRKVAWLASAALGVATVLGVLTITVFTRSITAGLPLAAGVTLYVAASDLIPEVNKEPGIRIALVVFLGVGLLVVLRHYFH